MRIPLQMQRSPLKRFLIAARVLLLVTLLFLPSMGVLMGVAFLTGSTRWFLFVGTPVVLANAAIVLWKPQRRRIWAWTGAISGRRSAV
jgi:hypothetical protein